MKCTRFKGDILYLNIKPAIMRKPVLSFFMACMFQFVLAQEKTASKIENPVLVGTVEGVSEYRLANGLQILLIPDATAANVVVNVVYHVGSRYEGYGETGMAHLLEHMMFKPSKKFSSIKQTIADKGANANGTTWYDRTDYYEILPAADSNLTWALDMESDRMVYSLMRNDDLQKEFSVVRNEFEAGENQPDNILSERIFSTMYLWHNYGKSTIGSKEDIERVPIASLVEFYRKYYQPDNATLIVGGKFDAEKALGLINKFFGPIKKPARVLQQPYTVEPPQDGERYVELRRNGDMQYVQMAYHTPAFADKDYAANSAVIDILTNDPSGIFHKALVDTKLATKVTGGSYILYDPGFSFFSCDVPLDKNLDSAKMAFLHAADNLPDAVISQQDLDRAKNAILKDLSNSQNNTVGFSVDLAEFIAAGNWKLFYLYRDRIKSLTLGDVQQTLKKYYLPSNRTVGVFIPDKNAEKERVVMAQTPDVNALVKDYKGNATRLQTESFVTTMPNIRDKTQYGSLSNGMKYALLKKPTKGDKIYAGMILKYGDEKSLTDKNEISVLTARMLKNGTTTKSKKDIKDLLDKINTTIDFVANGNSVSVSLNTDRDNLNAALDLLADLLQHPAFDKNEYDKSILDVKSEWESNLSNPQTIGLEALEKKAELYPKGHPLYPESTEEKLKFLQTLSLDDLKSFYNQFYGANHGFVSFVGNIDPQTIKSFLEKNLASFNSKQPYSDIALKYFDVNGSTTSINIKDKTNAWCWGVTNMPLKQGDPDYIALHIANEMIGGGAFLSSRIPKRLREAEGMSYGAGSFIRADYKYATSNWGVYAIFNPIFKNRLDSALHDEINKILTSGFTADELAKTKAGWLQERKTELGSDEDLASLLASYMEQGKDLDFYISFEDKAGALTLEQVNAVVRKYIRPDKLILVYAGTFEK
jgi:zinc protease